MAKRIQKEYTKQSNAIIKELIGPPLQIIIEISKYSDVLLIDEVHAGQETGEILIFDVNDLCEHISAFYINGINVSEAISSGKQLGIPIPKHFLLAGIEVGENELTEINNHSENNFVSGTFSLLLQKNMDSIYQTLCSIITDFLNKSL